MLKTRAEAEKLQCRQGGHIAVSQRGIAGDQPAFLFPNCIHAGCNHWDEVAPVNGDGAEARGRCGLVRPITPSESGVAQ